MAHPTGRPESYWNQFGPEPGPNDPPPSTWLPRAGSRLPAASAQSSQQIVEAHEATFARQWKKGIAGLFIVSLVGAVISGIALLAIVRSTGSVTNSLWGVVMFNVLLFSVTCTVSAVFAAAWGRYMKRKLRKELFPAD